MLQFDVTVPEFGETITIPNGGTMVGDGKSVAVTITEDESPAAAFLLPAGAALALSRGIYQAARKADPEGTSFMGILRGALAGNA